MIGKVLAFFSVISVVPVTLWTAYSFEPDSDLSLDSEPDFYNKYHDPQFDTRTDDSLIAEYGNVTGDEQNAVGFTQSTIRCWVCAECPNIKNGIKNENATQPRWCPPSMNLKATYTCVTFAITRKWFSNIFHIIFGGKNRRGLRQKSQRNDTFINQTAWHEAKQIYRGCASYEGLCSDIEARGDWSWLFAFGGCTECKGDMCNESPKALTPIYTVVPSLSSLIVSNQLLNT